MSLTSLLRRFHLQRNNRQAYYAGAGRRPRFEMFEDRRMLSLTAAVNFTTDPATPSAIATADFNNDGVLDLATCANALTGSFSVLLGDGAGGFGEAQRTILGTSLSSLAAANFNNDAHVDMLVSDGGGFYVLMGNGDGTFQPADYTFGGGMVAVGDFNSDNNMDVLVSWIDGDWWTHLQVYRGNGEGGFTPGADAYYGGWGGMAPVDLDNDDKLDVATGEGLVFVNVNGQLQFDWHQQSLLGGGAITSGDFTGDGNADVIVAGNGVAVLLGRGDGRLDAPLHYSASGSFNAVATADFNADGNLDAIVTDSNAGTANVLLGNGDGTLRYGGAFVTGTSPSGVAVGDYNGDGRPDLAVSNAGSKNVSVLLNDGDWDTIPPAPPALSITDTTVTEGDTGTLNASFVVTLSQPAGVDVTVRYDTANITATAATDFVAASGTLTIPAGQTNGTITIAIKSDLFSEATETFALNLSNPANAVIANGRGIGTIIDNDPQPTLSINDISQSEGNSTTKAFTFTVSLSAASSQAVTVNYATANGTAAAGSDYQPKSGSITFAAGEVTKTITISVTGDKVKEANETFFVSLSGAIGAEILDGQGLGTILDNDSVKGAGGGPKGRTSSTTLAIDEAIEDLLFPGRKKRAR
jgi:hypothetical protein